MYPVLFQIGGIEFYSNVIVIFIGMMISILYLIYKVKKNNLSVNFLDDYFYIFIFSFLFSGRVGDLFLKSSFYLGNPEKMLYFWDGNFSFFIGLIGMLFVFYCLTFIKKENFLKWLDTIFPAFLLGMLFLSFSNFLSGENYGKPTSLFLGVVFNSPEVKYTLPIHPVQIYEFLSVLIIFLFTIFISRKKRFTGVLASFGSFLFFLSEFIIEFFRSGVDKMIFGYKFNQILFLLLAFISLVFFIFRSHKNIDIYSYKK